MNAVRSIAAWGLAGFVGLLGACGLNTEGGLAGPAGTGAGGGEAGAAGMGGGISAGGHGTGGITGKGGSGGSEPDASAGGAAGTGGTPAEGGAAGSAEGGSPGSGGAVAQGGAAGSGGTPAEGGAAGAGGSTGPETNCLNGTDDDGDGKADCADDDCTKAGYVDLPPLPTGAQLFWLHERPLSESAPACPTQWQGAFFEFNAGSTLCDCECGAATGGECNTPSTAPITTQNANCGGGTSTASWNTCFGPIPDNWTIAGLKGGNSTVKAKGVCTPSVKQVTTDPSFAKAADLCPVQETGTGTGGTGACVAAAPADYGAKACALFDGDIDCSKIAGYTHPHTYFTGQSDSRVCEVQGCTCDPAPTTCQAKVAFYSDDKCTTVLKQYPTKDANCIAMNPAYSNGTAGSYEGVIVLTLAPCVAKGAGTVSGTAEPTGKKTLCCP